MVGGRLERAAGEDSCEEAVQGRQLLAPCYLLHLSSDLHCWAGVAPGLKIPVITDRNPHLESLVDSRRAVYLPFTRETNLVAGLPNTAGMFFTSQSLAGADIAICYDRTLHEFWVVSVSRVYREGAGPGSGQDRLWRRLVEFQAYTDRVLDLLTRLGHHARILFRLSCVPSVKEDPASRLNDYFR